MNIEVDKMQPETREAYCKSCEQDTMFRYRGAQINPVRGKILHLYDCKGCNTTRTLETETITCDSPDRFKQHTGGKI